MKKIIIDPKCAGLAATIYNGEIHTYIIFDLCDSKIPEMGKEKLLEALGSHCLNADAIRQGNGTLIATDFSSEDEVIRHLRAKRVIL